MNGVLVDRSLGSGGGFLLRPLLGTSRKCRLPPAIATFGSRADTCDDCQPKGAVYCGVLLSSKSHQACASFSIRELAAGRIAVLAQCRRRPKLTGLADELRRVFAYGEGWSPVPVAPPLSQTFIRCFNKLVDKRHRPPTMLPTNAPRPRSSRQSHPDLRGRSCDEWAHPRHSPDREDTDDAFWRISLRSRSRPRPCDPQRAGCV